jgi:hypothetical protein
MFYWLDSFTQCLPPFFHQGIGSNPTSCTVFSRYADLIKWIDGLTGWSDTVSRLACCARVHLARVGRRLTSIDVQRKFNSNETNGPKG